LPTRLSGCTPRDCHPDGRLVGTWSWNKAARRVEPALVRGRTSPRQREFVRARAEMLSDTLLRGWQNANANGTGGAGPIHSHQDELDLIW
jgi:hypothetical protein